MKAVVVNEFGGGFHTEEVSIADPIGKEVLIEVKASGLCHSDLTLANHDLGYPPPAVFGHEVAGVVTAIGSEVTEFAVGDHVVGSLIQVCGHCTSCLNGRSFQCLHPEETLRSPEQSSRLSRESGPVSQGFGLGGFAQQALIHSNQLVKIDDAMPFPQAALLGCGGLTGAGAVLNTADVQPGESVVIVGAGGVGLNAVNGAIIAGAGKIIVVDVADDKLEKAKLFGATHTVNSTTEDAVAYVQAVTQGGADYVFDFVGIGAVEKQGLDMLRIGGGLYMIGVSPGKSEFQLDAVETVSTQKRIVGVYMGSSTLKRDVPVYVDLYLKGRIKLDELVSKEISLDEVTEGYESLKDSSVTRVVITRF